MTEPQNTANKLIEKHGKNFAVVYCNEWIVSLTVNCSQTDEIIKKISFWQEVKQEIINYK